mgnify:CR=1 FL=1
MNTEQSQLATNRQSHVDFLYRAVNLFYETQMLANGNGTVEFCNVLLGGVQVFCGIEALAQAAGQSVTTQWSGNADYPLEAAFTFCGVRFYQLKGGEA